MAQKNRTVGDIMVRAVVSVGYDTARAEIVALIERHRIGAVAVCDRGHVVGVVSKGDLMARSGTTARDLMTPVVHSVRSDFPWRAAAHRMLALGVHRLLVVDDGVQVGVVTATDFLRMVLESGETGL